MSISRQQSRNSLKLQLEHLEGRVAPAVLSPASFANDGISFNTAVRQVEGGLYALAAQESNQAISTVATFTKNLTNVRDTIAAEQASATGDLHNVSATTAAHLATIIADLTTAINNAPNEPTGAAAETAIHNSMIQILNVVNGDAALKGLAANTAAVDAAYPDPGFKQIPPRLPAGETFANAPHANLAEIGRMFDDASHRLEGGNGSAANKAMIIGDLNAVKTDLTALQAAHPELFGGLTGIHLQVIINQIPGEIGFINDVGINPVANHGTRDISLDLIDIVQGDVNLLNEANIGGVSGFNVFPTPRTAPTPYQMDTNQTNTYADLIAKGNVLAADAVSTITNTPENTAAINALITRARDLGQEDNNLVTAGGLIFRARFDNEQRAATGTQGADIAALIHGLQTENVTEVQNATFAINANFADTAGNSFTMVNGVGGGTFNTNGTTIAGVLG